MMQNTQAREIKAGPPIMLRFDVSFDRAAVPFERRVRLNSGLILMQFAREGHLDGSGKR